MKGLSKNIIALLLLSWHTWSLPAQSFDPHAVPLDTLLKWLRPNLQDPAVDSTAYEYAHIALKRAQAEQESAAIATAYLFLAEWQNFHFDFFGELNDSAIYYDRKAIAAFEAIGDEEQVAMMHYFLVLDLHGIGRYNEAEIAAFQAIELFDALGDQVMKGRLYVRLSSVYHGIRDTLKAIEYGEKGTTLLDELGVTAYDYFVYTYLAAAYDLAGDYNNVIPACNRAIASFEKHSGEDRYWDPQYLDAHQYRGKAYLQLEEYDKALQDFEYVLQLSERYYDGSHSYESYLNIGQLERKRGNYAAALVSLEKAQAANRSIDAEDYELAEELALVHESLGDFEKALRYERQAEAGRKAILQDQITSLKSELLAKYESAQKDATIESQQTQLQQTRRIQYLSFGVAGLLVLLLGGLYYTFRNNRKKNLQLATLNNNLQATNTQLDQRNAQNELLLKEIHHRVKNNLETVSSLLELQSAQVEDTNAQSVMQASQSRVQSMSIIHQKLYQGENLANIEMRDYFNNLGDSLLDTFDAWEQVSIEYDMPELELDVDTAMPIGLIVNELVTNALKYAFPDGEEKGEIRIQLKWQSDNTLYLQVSDNGIGKQAGLSPKGTGFGSQLVQLLTRQLNGSMQESEEEGLVTTFLFRP